MQDQIADAVGLLVRPPPDIVIRHFLHAMDQLRQIVFLQENSGGLDELFGVASGLSCCRQHSTSVLSNNVRIYSQLKTQNSKLPLIQGWCPMISMGRRDRLERVTTSEPFKGSKPPARF